MKRVLIVLLLALSLAFVTQADPNAPFLPLNGGASMSGGSNIGLASYHVNTGTISVPCYATVDLTKGQVVVLAPSGSTVKPMSVTLTTTVGDPRVFGVVEASASYGQIVQVVVHGVAKCTIHPINLAFGQQLISSGVAGKLTGVAEVAEDVFTGLSKTAVVGFAAEYKVNDASGHCRCFIYGK